MSYSIDSWKNTADQFLRPVATMGERGGANGSALVNKQFMHMQLL